MTTRAGVDPPITRRRAVRAAAVSALGAYATLKLDAKQPDIRFPSAPRDRVAIASYPFRAAIPKTLPLLDFPALAARRFGVHNVELLGSHFVSTEAGYLDSLRVAANQARVRIVNIPVGSPASAYDPDPDKRKAAVEDARKWVDAAVRLECPSLRVHIRAARGIAPDARLAADTMRAIVAYAEEKNIVVHLENDDPKSEQASFLVDVIERVASPFLRALPDFCNSMLIGPEQYNYDSVKAMFAHAYAICHVKDSEVEGGRVYSVDVDRTFAIAKASGYRGYFSMEFEGAGDPYDGTQKLIDMTLRNLAA